MWSASLVLFVTLVSPVRAPCLKEWLTRDQLVKDDANEPHVVLKIKNHDSDSCTELKDPESKLHQHRP